MQIAAEHKLLFIEYKIQTETREKKLSLSTLEPKKRILPKQMKIAFLLYNMQKSITECR